MSIFEWTTNDSDGNDSTKGKLLDQTATSSLGKDEIFDVLRNERRRRVLRYLDAADGDVEIGELAEALAELESDGDTYGQRDRKRTYNALYQIHLPKMADIGIVEYERQRGRIRLGHEFDRVEPYLYASRDSSVRWDRMYLVVGLVIAAVLVPGYLWSSTVASIPEEVWFGILVGICSFLLAVHLARSSEWIDAEWFRA